MDKPHLRIWDQAGSRAEQMAFVQEVERRGFPGVWSPSRGDNVAFLLAVLERTERITVATGIAHIYLRHPQLMGQAGSLIEELHPGRLLLGLGVSHQPTHKELGLSVGRPLTDMREYVAEMRAHTEGAAFPRLVLATLRRRMTALASEIAGGAALGQRRPLAHGDLARRDPARAPRRLLRRGRSSRRRSTTTARPPWPRRATSCSSTSRGPTTRRTSRRPATTTKVAAARAAIAAGDEEARLAAISERFIADACLVGTASEVREQAEAWDAEGVTLVLAPAPEDRASVERALAVFD